MPFNLGKCFGGCYPSRPEPKKEIAHPNSSIYQLANHDVMNDIIRSAKTLVYLDLKANRIKQLPPKFYKTKFSKLEKINISDNELQVIHSDIRYFDCLKELDVQKNELEELPREIGNCKSLERLLLGANPMSNLPDEITRLWA